jgi:hypothetical protein
MRTLITFLLLISFSSFVIAQKVETIKMKDGSTMEVTVLKINPDSVYLERVYKDNIFEKWFHADQITDYDVLLKKYSTILDPFQINESGRIYFERVIQAEGLTMDEIYLRLIDWYGQAFKEPESVIKFNSRETGKINGIFSDYYSTKAVFGGEAPMKLNSSIELVIKDGRFKVLITDFGWTSTYGAMSLEKTIFKDDGSLRPSYKLLSEDIKLKISVLFDNISSYVNNYKKIDGNW